MPQMFPLMWLILFLSTSFSMLLMSSFIFFSSKPAADSIKMKTSHPQQNWKW